MCRSRIVPEGHPASEGVFTQPRTLADGRATGYGLGLARQALPFRRHNHPDSVTFVIEGSLDDGELQRARQFVDGYYRQWGSRYVQFATELKDDWLKGKSFKYGNQGYVKMETGHWYFPKPL